MNDLQLQKLVRRVSLKYFAMPFLHRAKFDYQLRSTGGRYHLATHNIDINPRMLTDFSKANLVRVIKHELCHYHLCLAGYSGRHDTKRFRQMLTCVGGSRYAPQPRKIKWFKYRCQRCGKIYHRRRRVNVNRYVCSQCYGRLKLVQVKVVE